MIVIDKSASLVATDDYFYEVIDKIYDLADGVFRFANISDDDLFDCTDWIEGETKGEFPYETCEISSNLELFLRRYLGIVERINSQNLTDEQKENNITLQYFNKLIDYIKYEYDKLFELIDNNGSLSLKFIVRHWRKVCDPKAFWSECDKVTSDKELTELILRTVSKNYTGNVDDIDEDGYVEEFTEVIFESIKSTDENENILTLLYDCFIKPNL